MSHLSFTVEETTESTVNLVVLFFDETHDVLGFPNVPHFSQSYTLDALNFVEVVDSIFSIDKIHHNLIDFDFSQVF